MSNATESINLTSCSGQALPLTPYGLWVEKLMQQNHVLVILQLLPLTPRKMRTPFECPSRRYSRALCDMFCRHLAHSPISEQVGENPVIRPLAEDIDPSEWLDQGNALIETS